MQRVFRLAFGLLVLATARSATAGSKNAGVRTARSAPFTAFGTWNGVSVMTTLIRQYQSEGARASSASRPWKAIRL